MVLRAAVYVLCDRVHEISCLYDIPAIYRTSGEKTIYRVQLYSQTMTLIKSMKEKATFGAVDPKSLQSDILPLGGPASSASGNMKRRGLSCVLLAMLSVFCILVSAARPFTIWSPSSHLDILRKEKQLVVPAPGMNFAGNGRTTDILWDEYSLIIKGQRVFIQ